MKGAGLRVVLIACCACLLWPSCSGELPPTSHASSFAGLEVPAPDPAAPVDYIAWYNGRLVGGRSDAFDAYLAAYQRLHRFVGGWGKTLVEPWSEDPVVAAWLQANDEGLVLFSRAAARSDFEFRLHRSRELREPRLGALFLAWEKPGWVGHLNASRGLIAAGWRAWQTGDEKRLRENALLVLRAAHHLQSTPWPIARLVGDGAARPAYEALRHALARSRDPVALAETLAEALQQVDPPLPPFAHACTLLRVEHWDLCQRVFLPRDSGGSWLVHRGVIRELAPLLQGEPEALAERLEAIGMETSLQESDAYYAALERWNALPFHLAAGEPFPLDQLRASSDNPLHRLQAQLTVWTRARIESTIAQRRATHLIVHLILHRARAGAYPDTLGQLEVADLATLRRDPFSDGDLVYRRNGDEFVLYSLAYNMRDDGGRHDPEWTDGDYLFWPVRD